MSTARAFRVASSGILTSTLGANLARATVWGGEAGGLLGPVATCWRLSGPMMDGTLLEREQESCLC